MGTVRTLGFQEAMMSGVNRLVCCVAVFLGAISMADPAAPARWAGTRTAAQARAPAGPADLVLRGGSIVTVDAARPEAQALAVVGDRIAAIGSNEEIQAHIGARTRVIELNGALALPGFIDAHAHFPGVGQAARNLKLAPATSWDEIVRMVGEA